MVLYRIPDLKGLTSSENVMMLKWSFDLIWSMMVNRACLVWFSFFPYIDPLTSITKATVLRIGSRPPGEKWWTKTSPNFCLWSKGQTIVDQQRHLQSHTILIDVKCIHGIGAIAWWGIIVQLLHAVAGSMGAEGAFFPPRVYKTHRSQSQRATIVLSYLGCMISPLLEVMLSSSNITYDKGA